MVEKCKQREVMKNQVLSIEQMKHLKELGVDTSNTSAVLLFYDEEGDCVGWDVEYDYKDQVFKHLNYLYEVWMPCRIEIVDAETGNYDHSFRDECGTFTLQDILNVMPKTIEVKDERLYLECGLYDESNKSVKGVLSIDFVSNAVSYNVYGYEGVDLRIPYSVSSYSDGDGGFCHEFCDTPVNGDTLLESAYQMLCWLAENGYLKNREE